VNDNTDIWTQRYGHICPDHQGSIVTIEGLADKDAYNPGLYESPSGKVLAFRCENRSSTMANPATYHPEIRFATPASGEGWFTSGALPPFDMLEDPFFFYVVENGARKVVFGGVRLDFSVEGAVANTELYKGDSLGSLPRTPWIVIEGMKDIRIRQLPDGRYLVCKRPQGGDYGAGRITIHIVEKLENINNPMYESKPLAILDSGTDIDDWVGVNSIYLIQDMKGVAWVGLLGHVGLRDAQGNMHYAACTYKISLQQLLDSTIPAVIPKIIAVRSCFEAGPAKTPQLADVVFPGHLEQIDAYRYNLWTGLSDARVGRLEIFDPFDLQ
jgi:hypothetical protein